MGDWMVGWMSGWTDGWTEGRKKGKRVGEGGKWIMDGWTDRWKNTENVRFPKSQPHGSHPEFSQQTSVGFQEDTSVFWSIRPGCH